MDIYDEILKSLETEDHVMLATIIRTTGSTPASALSKMLIRQQGIVSVGTVGGGCMEGDVITAAHKLYDAGTVAIVPFQLNEDDVEHGLICGGSLDIFIEPITRRQISLIRALRTLRDEGKNSLLVTLIEPNKIIGKKFIVDSEKSIPEIQEKLGMVPVDIDELAMKAFHRNEIQCVQFGEQELIVEPIAGSPALIIFGGGHVSKYVCRFASAVGFRVMIVDDRPSFANRQRFPEAVETIADDFMSVFDRMSFAESSYIVIVTRGHRYDEEVLERAIRTGARYIGMIGSRKKVLTTFQHILDRGGSPEALQRVYAPIGIDVGAVTAEEIALSIVAELTKIRRDVASPLCSKSEAIKELVSHMQKS
ncbi:MAG TPA: XdhC family protein [Bacteroidota bacterium]|nr:XdhC family protein [Bacteroidota bacterium]